VLLEMLAECSVVSSRSWKPAGSCTAHVHKTHGRRLPAEACDTARCRMDCCKAMLQLALPLLSSTTPSLT
jgi:hypothetical protein